MWQNWQNKILREAAKFGYKSEEAEFYEQELDEQIATIKNITFKPYKVGRMNGWTVFAPPSWGQMGTSKVPANIGFLQKGVSTKTTTTPTKLLVLSNDSTGIYGTSFSKLVLNFWPASKVSGMSIPPKSGEATNIVGEPKKMLEMIADWILKNSDKI